MNFAAFLVGILFALGLGVAQMTQPQMVIAFLDLSGSWNPALAFVMLGAIGVHSLSYRIIRKRPSPLLTEEFHIPSNQNLDRKLLAGASLFGLGWGLAGYCPGPALVSLASGQTSSLMFVSAMITGMILFRVLGAPKGT